MSTRTTRFLIRVTQSRDSVRLYSRCSKNQRTLYSRICTAVVDLTHRHAACEKILVLRCCHSLEV